MTAVLIAAVCVVVIALLIEERSGMLKVGSHAPAFSGTDHEGRTVALADFLGTSDVVLFFYPKDFTSGCTQEACGFRDSIDRIRELGAVVIGVSHDTARSHAAFAQRNMLPFPLIADTDGMLRRSYGVLRFGGLLPLTKRVTYVIDRQGIVRAALHEELFMGRHTAGVIAVLELLRAGTAGDNDVSGRNRR